MPELLLELLSEEIPARMQARAAENLRRLVTDGLKAAGLDYSDAQAFVTPRRLVLVVEGLPEKQPDVNDEKKGPKVGAPDQALQGFMKANGLSDISEAEIRETPKGSSYFVVRQIAGRESAIVLPELLEAALRAMPWPKSMRWGKSTFRWVRPLHGIMAVFSGEAISGAFDLGGGEALTFSNQSAGHRFLAPGAFTAGSFTDYRDKLRDAFVVLDAAERREMILARAREACAEAGLTLKEDQGLLEEVVGLVEWPVVLLGTIDKAFMTLPPEVLVTSLRSHQKYFSTLDAKGELANRFVFVSNMAAEDGGAQIVAGNQRVLGARLADARFFWDQDRKTSLAERAPGLEEIVFHAELGTVAEKVSRIQSLAVFLSAYVEEADRDRARSAARLCKADLTTGMVGEFPELQGVMGHYYALHDGEHPEVAEAIADHYAPQGPNDRCPNAPVSVVVSLADKIDTLAGFWAIDEKPTGSKDPFALRRAALGVIRLIVENKLRLPLAEVLSHALTPYGRAGLSVDTGAIVADLLVFFADRLKVALKDKGVRHDLITAVFALGGEDDLTRILDRVAALRDFVASEDGANLLVAHGRAANIVRIESGKDKRGYNEAVDVALLAEPEERALFDALEAGRGAADRALASEDFTAAMAAMAALRRPVDDFFDRVTVNAEEPDLRVNRLRLLAAMDATLSRVADFSKIEG